MNYSATSVHLTQLLEPIMIIIAVLDYNQLHSNYVLVFML